MRALDLNSDDWCAVDLGESLMPSMTACFSEFARVTYRGPGTAHRSRWKHAFLAPTPSARVTKLARKTQPLLNSITRIMALDPLVLIHGWPRSGASWEKQTAHYLPRVIASSRTTAEVLANPASTGEVTRYIGKYGVKRMRSSSLSAQHMPCSILRRDSKVRAPIRRIDSSARPGGCESRRPTTARSG